MKVTATISTRDRYFTTLPILLSAVINQTTLPEKLILFDDGEQRDLREHPTYKHIFRLLEHKQIEWEVSFGQRIGQVANHQRAIYMATSELIWRLDDDQLPEPNVLSRLLSLISSSPKIGAVGGLIIDPIATCIKKPLLASSRIEDIFMGMNEQWYPHPKGSLPYEVDHLYSSFLFRRDASPGYQMDLSPVGHREETIFTYKMKRAGWRLLVEPAAVTWHLRNAEGGIRAHQDGGHWASDERIFTRLLSEWDVKPIEVFPIVLDCGLGDHLVFRYEVWPLIKAFHKNKKIVIADCYPEVFEEETGFEEISIAEAKAIWNIEKYDVYKFAYDRNLKKPLAEAFKDLYGVGG